jgi:hypothetical protein|tara:strand:- start:164 stop:445 length:282 start_codon:yes stop_codon:yes gene_type:complete
MTNDIREWLQGKPGAASRFVHIWQGSDNVRQVINALGFADTKAVRQDMYHVARRMRSKGVELKKFPAFASGRKKALDWNSLAKYAESFNDNSK